jgi:hypothetical protein
VSEVFVAVTIHVPAPLELSVDPETVQGPESITNVFVPLPLPPVVVNESAVPNVPDVELIISGVGCAPLPKVIVVWDDEIAL